jgi:hypothetical protein
MDQLFPEDIPLLPEDPEFATTGLRVPLKIRTTRIATLTKKDVIRRFGKLGKIKSKFSMKKSLKCFNYDYQNFLHQRFNSRHDRHPQSPRRDRCR